jgi:hypothetical protein
MSSELLIGLEMAGVLGLALAWCGYELWKLRQYREQDERERAQREQRQRDAASPATEDSQKRD